MSEDNDPCVADFAKTIQESFWAAIDKKTADIKDRHISIDDIIKILDLKDFDINIDIKEEVTSRLKWLAIDHSNLSREVIELRVENAKLRDMKSTTNTSGCDACEEFMKNVNERLRRLESKN